jgi:hypothetical protein
LLGTLPNTFNLAVAVSESFGFVVEYHTEVPHDSRGKNVVFIHKP